MKKLILLFILITSIASAQKIKFDTLIHTPIFDSYYSNSDECPVIVTYKLYKGGGECPRENDVFKNDIKTIKSAVPADYSHSGYDEGHMADSKDFAYDCSLQESTFRFYNCVPQLPILNRGPWKHYESQVRRMSRTDSLLVVCYNHFSSTKLRGNVSVPDTCYKLVYSLTTHKLIMSIAIENTEDVKESKATISLIAKIEETIQFKSN